MAVIRQIFMKFGRCLNVFETMSGALWCVYIFLILAGLGVIFEHKLVRFENRIFHFIKGVFTHGKAKN